MDFYSRFATNTKHEEEGREFTNEFGPNVSFTIARANNKTYNRMIQALLTAHEHTIKAKGTQEERDAAEECSTRIMIEVMAKSILLGWSGDVVYDGEPLPYTPDNAVKLLQLPEFRKLVDKLSSDFQNYRLVTEDEAVKKLESSSNGTSPGAEASSTTLTSSAT